MTLPERLEPEEIEVPEETDYMQGYTADDHYKECYGEEPK